MQIKPIGNSLKDKKPIYLLKDIETFIKSFNYSVEEYNDKLNNLWLDNNDIIIIENLILDTNDNSLNNNVVLNELKTTINEYNELLKTLDDIDKEINNNF